MISLRALEGPRGSGEPPHLPAQQRFGLSHDVFGLRQDRVLEIRMVTDPGVHGGYAAHGCVQVFEEIAGYASRDLGSVTEAEGILVNDKNA